MPNRAVWAEVNVGAVEHNIREIQKKVAGGAKFCAVVKANAYGHGAVPIAQAAIRCGADYLAVAVLSEGIELRAAGISLPVLILSTVPDEQAADLVKYDITATVYSLESAKVLSAEAVRQGKCVKMHLAVDTGMGRIGIAPEQAGLLAAEIQKLPAVDLEGMFSHFAMADSRDKAFAYVQLERFKTAISAVEAVGIHLAIRHIANSAAALEMPETHFDMVRAGIILYGLWPSGEVARNTDLRPAMRLKAKISHVKTVEKGRPISYGCTFVTERESIIATLPLGYADGYTRLFSGKAAVEISGKRAKVVGRICMDQCMIDVTDIENPKIGQEVTLFGSETLTADEAADWIGTINYEIICMVSSRVPRVYI